MLNGSRVGEVNALPVSLGEDEVIQAVVCSAVGVSYRIDNFAQSIAVDITVGCDEEAKMFRSVALSEELCLCLKAC